MTNNKLTNKWALEIAIEVVAKSDYYDSIFGIKVDDVVAKLERMKEQIEKKSYAERKPTKEQEKNKILSAVIFEYLKEQTEGKTVTDMMKEIPELDGLTNQKVSALVKPLKDDELVEKEIKKGRSYFFVKKD